MMSAMKTEDIEVCRERLKNVHIVTDQEKKQLDNYLTELEIYRSFGSLEDSIHNARNEEEKP